MVHQHPLLTIPQIRSEDNPPTLDSENKGHSKKPLPGFWKVLKHPLPSDLAIDSKPSHQSVLSSLTEQQRSTYDHLLNTINDPKFRLPIPKPPSEPQIDSNPAPQQSSDHQLTESERWFCSRECLLRISRATKWDSSRALKRLIETLIWRREFQVDQLDHRVLSYEAQTGKLFTLGYDKQQRPILYMFPYRENTNPSINQIRLLVWYLERTIDLMPPGVETLTLIIDFGVRNMTSSSSSSNSNQNRNNNLSTPISTAKEVLKIFQTYYCERLAQAICINVPWVFWGFFKILKPLMDPTTAEKILFDPVVTDYVPSEHLLKVPFGGDLDFQYDHETYFPLLADFTALRRRKMLNRYRRIGKGMIGITEFELRSANRRIKGPGDHSFISSSSTQASPPKSRSIPSPSSSPKPIPPQHQSYQLSSTDGSNLSSFGSTPTISVSFKPSINNSYRTNQNSILNPSSSPTDNDHELTRTLTTINSRIYSVSPSFSPKRNESSDPSFHHSVRLPMNIGAYASRPLSFVESTLANISFDKKTKRTKLIKPKSSYRSVSEQSKDSFHEHNNQKKQIMNESDCSKNGLNSTERDHHHHDTLTLTREGDLNLLTSSSDHQLVKKSIIHPDSSTNKKMARKPNMRVSFGSSQAFIYSKSFHHHHPHHHHRQKCSSLNFNSSSSPNHQKDLFLNGHEILNFNSRKIHLVR